AFDAEAAGGQQSCDARKLKRMIKRGDRAPDKSVTGVLEQNRHRFFRRQRSQHRQMRGNGRPIEFLKVIGAESFEERIVSVRVGLVHQKNPPLFESWGGRDSRRAALARPARREPRPPKSRTLVEARSVQYIPRPAVAPA